MNSMYSLLPLCNVHNNVQNIYWAIFGSCTTATQKISVVPTAFNIIISHGFYFQPVLLCSSTTQIRYRILPNYHNGAVSILNEQIVVCTPAHRKIVGLDWWNLEFPTLFCATIVAQNVKITWDILACRLPSLVLPMLFLHFGPQKWHKKFLARIPQMLPSQAQWLDHTVIHPRLMTDIFPGSGEGGTYKGRGDNCGEYGICTNTLLSH